MSKEYLNPKELFPSLQYGFSQIVATQGDTTVYLSGQVAWDAEQQIVGGDDLGAQTRQALQNIDLAMQAAGGTLADVVSLRIYILKEKLGEMEPISAALKALFPAERAPATTWVGVYGLANPAFLIEIEAIGVIEVGRRGKPAGPLAANQHRLFRLPQHLVDRMTEDEVLELTAAIAAHND